MVWSTSHTSTSTAVRRALATWLWKAIHNVLSVALSRW